MGQLKYVVDSIRCDLSHILNIAHHIELNYNILFFEKNDNIYSVLPHKKTSINQISITSLSNNLYFNIK